ncbi:uncharacterized protein LOC107042024 [Diachasma alloeum]|uniref:uncharacterized protein LOC107042024 n=1 Tax=Diachasma alloeum TaxID=454923 RepID=UPI0007381077|nr:uncharacterized protein LOC107042024 [Diachasma alloeum]
MSFAGRIMIQASRAKFIESLKAESIAAGIKEISVTELQSKLDILEMYSSQFEEQHLKLLSGKDSAEILEHEYGILLSGPLIKIFLSMVVGNDALSTVKKLHYLLTSLIGEPKQLVSTLPVSDDSFIPAWEMLISRYDNKRLLTSIQLEKLFSTPKIINRLAKEFNSLLNSTTEALNALKTLGRPVQHWDDILVRVISSRLDSQTMEAWEIKIDTTTTFPSYNELEEFLLTRARARQRIELHAPEKSATTAPQQPQKPRLAKVLNVSAGTQKPSEQRPFLSWAEMSENVCSMCSDGHHIDKCPTFKQLSREKRKEFVEKQNLCFNCLGKHSLRNCRTTKSCVVCHKRHHSMIHINSSQSGSTVTNSAVQSRVQPSKPLLEASPQLRPGVLLTTAVASLVGENRISFEVRMLLDPGSELSFVANNLVVKLGLWKSPALLPVVGISGSSICSNGFSQFCLKSLHSEKQIEIKAYILDRLTTSLPSFSVSQTQSWSHLKGLKLADPEFLKPRPIDLLIGADFVASIVEPQIIKRPSDSPIAMFTIFG